MSDLIAAFAFLVIVVGLPLVALWWANRLERRRRRILARLTAEQRAIYAQFENQPKSGNQR